MGKFSWIAVRCLLLISSIHAQTFPVPLIPATVPALEYHKSCLYNQYLLLIGGNDISNPGAKTLNREFYVANTSSGITWYRATFPESSKYPLTTTNIPSTFVVLGLHKIDNSVLLLLSSSTGTSLHSFSLDTGIWSIPSASLTPLQLLGLPVQQPPQIGAGACTSQSKVVNGNESRNLVYLYGQTAGTGTSFMYLLDVEGLKWVQVSNLGRARNGVGCVGLDDGAIIMGGVPITGEGVSANALMDVFRYTLSSGNWANVTVEPGDIPVSVSDPVATILVKNSVFVYGGLTNGGQLVGTISRLELGSGGASWRLVGENVPSSSGSSVYDASRDVAIFLLTINGTSKTLESLNYKTQLQKFISNAELSAVAVAQSPSPTGDVNPTLNLPSQPPNQTTTIVVSVVVALVASLTIILIIYLKRNPSAKSRLSVEMSWVRGFNRNSSGGETSGDEEKWETSKERKLPALTRYREQMRNKQDEEKEIPVSKITGLPLFEAVADFTPFNKNEIAIKIGDWITIREHDVFSDGWCIGINETTKSVGIFPIFCLGLEQVMNEIVVTPTVPAIPSISVLPRSSSYTCGEKLEELNGLLAAAAPKSAMKSLTSKPSIRKTVKIVAPESVISESDISSMQEELANGSDGLIVPLRASSRDFVLPA
ncbi:hypothetical protein HK098_005680 [Nowakowskiella sp. JEL0407]|nr:hypothetical protein HK098_005680 [Nowakowskiella sp. JEL0407]